MATYSKNNPPADKANCTFWWIIYLEPNSRIPELTGYSKFQNQAEAKDPEQCLMSKCEMLFKNGYLQRAKKIEIFKRKAPLPNFNEDVKILTLYNNDYEPHEKLFNVYPTMFSYLKNFYGAITEGREIKNLRPLPAQTKSNTILKDKAIEDSFKRCSKISELTELKTKLTAQGEAVGLVNHLYNKYWIKIKNYKN